MLLNFVPWFEKAGRFRAFVLDDSAISRGRSKKVKLLAFVLDHAIHKRVKGSSLLTLGWTDGYSFIPVAFHMLPSAKKTVYGLFYVCCDDVRNIELSEG